MTRADTPPPDTSTPPAGIGDVPPQDGTLGALAHEARPADNTPPRGDNVQRSGCLHRPLDEISRRAVDTADARTPLEQYKAGLRKYAPVQKGIAGLPWEGQWYSEEYAGLVPGRLLYDRDEDKIFLEYDGPDGAQYREEHLDVLFVKNIPTRDGLKRQPKTTYSGFVVRPILTGLPRTVETLCPECSCLLLGRYFVKDNAVCIEKTCPEHGYFRDKINSDVNLYLRMTTTGWEDEAGVSNPRVTAGHACPTDCGICNQHHSTACLAQIDLTNRCNMNCPVCFASANQAGYVAEPSYEMVVEMLRSLRQMKPVASTAVQFTGGEPTIHPRFLDLCRAANDMGFTHVQIATNGLRLSNLEFAEQAAEAGLHTLYLQFDGVDDAAYLQLRGQLLIEKKLQVIENCRKVGLKICLVPTVMKGVSQEQVGPIFRFACENADVISGIAYQPVSFSGRIDHEELEAKRYTLGDMAHDIAKVSGASLKRDFFPLNHVVPLSRIMQTLDGKPKVRVSCHSDCSLGTYFFVTPDHQAIPIPKLFDTMKLFRGFNELAAKIEARRPDKLANWKDKLEIVWTFLRSYRWTERDRRIGPFTFLRALQGMTHKGKGRGRAGEKNYRTLLAAGMHFMDRYNFDTERIRRCVILYSSADGIYPFCTINCGPTYRPYIEAMYAEPKR